MAIQKTQAIVLSNHDFRESSLLANFYTKDFGKLRGLVKGIRGPKLRYGSRLEPFSLNSIVFYESRKSNFCIIAQCDRLFGFNSLQENLEKAAYAGYFAELIDAVTSLEDANAPLFELLFNSLKLLSSESDIERIVRIFEIKLLNLSGFMPRLDCCVCCGERSGTPCFSYSLGGLLCAGCSAQDKAALPVSLGSIASLKHIESIDWRRVLRFKMTPAVKDELKKILRSFLDLHLERRFRSLAFLEKVKKFGESRKAQA